MEFHAKAIYRWKNLKGWRKSYPTQFWITVHEEK